MRRLFDQQLLYKLRNNCSIMHLIRDILKIPHHYKQGFHFQCPACSQYNTAINPSTNLARCFDCQKNFNPIDIVIAFKKLPFIDAVNFLLAHYKKPSPKMTRSTLIQSTGSHQNKDLRGASELTKLANILTVCKLTQS